MLKVKKTAPRSLQSATPGKKKLSKPVPIWKEPPEFTKVLAHTFILTSTATLALFVFSSFLTSTHLILTHFPHHNHHHHHHHRHHHHHHHHRHATTTTRHLCCFAEMASNGQTSPLRTASLPSDPLPSASLPSAPLPSVSLLSVPASSQPPAGKHAARTSGIPRPTRRAPAGPSSPRVRTGAIARGTAPTAASLGKYQSLFAQPSARPPFPPAKACHIT